MSGKTFPAPDGGDLTALLRQRRATTDEIPETFQAPPAAPAVEAVAVERPVAPAKEKRAASTEMDRRSWYMPKASADALAALVDELHWETRQPKQAVLAALIEVAVQHRDQVAKKLRHK